jgi:hypothetical protein
MKQDTAVRHPVISGADRPPSRTRQEWRFFILHSGENQWPISILPSSAAASTAPASRAMPPAAGCASCCRAERPCSGTSSASSKLIHGGLRYLEHGEFRLVRAALASAKCCCARRRI